MDMKSSCRMIAWIELIVGVICSFIIAYLVGETPGVTGTTLHVSRNWGLTIVVFMMCVFGTALNYFIFMSLANILEKQETLHAEIARVKIAKESEAIRKQNEGFMEMMKKLQKQMGNIEDVPSENI